MAPWLCLLTVAWTLGGACGCGKKTVAGGPAISNDEPSAQTPPKPPADGLPEPANAVTTEQAPSEGHKARMSTHPGTRPYDRLTDEAIAAALAAVPPTYRPRTRHHGGQAHRQAAHAEPRAPAGAKPNFTNRLILEASPYLRQHAHNPVDWRPWGAAAFAEARALGRPIFLSVGYATCHWCHVMEHESFEDLAIAKLLNSRYVPVKVDREERPDVDAVYMAAVQAMGLGGGWPMSVWIAPGRGTPGQDLHGMPFFAGTYFPPRQRRGSRPGFEGVLTDLADRFEREPEAIVAKGQRIASQLRRQLEMDWAGVDADVLAVDRLVGQLKQVYDNTHGGTQRPPKFPSNIPYGLLFRHYLRTGDRESRRMALHSLERMSMGGIYDHVGGGFARYSTDARWLVPHFEKMLYDQALIALSLVEAWQVSAKPVYARVARQTLDYVLREQQAPGGAFYSATDADSEGVEGLYFLWTVKQLVEALGKDDGALVAEIYGATAAGNFEGSNILHLTTPLAAWAERKGVSEARLMARLDKALERLRRLRNKRVPPLRDDKILTAWNGLMISALARAGFMLDEPRYRDAAARAADDLLRHQRDKQGRLLRLRLNGQAKGKAFVDDHAFLIDGLLELLAATGDARWLRAAVSLQRQQDRWHAAPRGAGFFRTASDAESLLARDKPDRDGALPGGNSLAALNLLRLAALTGDATWANGAKATLRAFSRRLRGYPFALTRMLEAVETQAWPLKELVIVRSEDSDPADFEPMLAALRANWQPHHVLLTVAMGPELEELGKLAPIARQKVARGGRVTAYVCQAGSCRLPTTRPKEMIEQLLARER